MDSGIDQTTCQLSERLYHVKQAKYDEYDGNYDQDMDPIAGLWEARAYIPTEKTEQP
jgi:hypothetical protein